MVGVSDLVDDEEDVADVKGDVAADLRIEDDVAHGAFPHAVEVEADEVSVGVDHRAAGVAACSVVCGYEAYGNLSGRVCPTSVIFFCIYVTQALRDIVVEDVGIVLLHDALDGG